MNPTLFSCRRFLQARNKLAFKKLKRIDFLKDKAQWKAWIAAVKRDGWIPAKFRICSATLPQLNEMLLCCKSSTKRTRVYETFKTLHSSYRTDEYSAVLSIHPPNENAILLASELTQTYTYSVHSQLPVPSVLNQVECLSQQLMAPVSPYS